MSEESACHFIHVEAPFDLALTVNVARRLPSNVLYPLKDGELRVVVSDWNGPVLVGVRSPEPDRVEYRELGARMGEERLLVVEGYIRRLLGLDVDLTELRKIFASEPTVAPLAQRLKGLRPPRFLSLWETLLQVIPFQQVSLASAMSAVNKLVATLGSRVYYEDREYFGAPPVERVLLATDDELRACGLSRAKVRALRGCAKRVRDGAVREDALASLSDDDAALDLMALPGIGPWSTQLILLRGFGRLGNFPAGDSGAARSLRDLFQREPDPDAAAMKTLASLGRWQGYLYFMLLARRYLDPT
ncbi:MAG TPA: hypothetical protein VF808_04930 [Ktedonobacterales bacterium]